MALICLKHSGQYLIPMEVSGSDVVKIDFTRFQKQMYIKKIAFNICNQIDFTDGVNVEFRAFGQFYLQSGRLNDPVVISNTGNGSYYDNEKMIVVNDSKEFINKDYSMVVPANSLMSFYIIINFKNPDQVDSQNISFNLNIEFDDYS